MNNQNLLMNQTRKALNDIARAENVPFSGVNKRVLIDRIQHMKSCCLSRGIQIACMTGVLMKRRKGFWREYGESQTALADLEFIA